MSAPVEPRRQAARPGPSKAPSADAPAANGSKRLLLHCRTSRSTRSTAPPSAKLATGATSGAEGGASRRAGRPLAEPAAPASAALADRAGRRSPSPSVRCCASSPTRTSGWTKRSPSRSPAATCRSCSSALRHDGSPPLYYLLLHFWMDVFGQSDVAVRALSGVLSLATLPLAWFAGRRVARGRRVVRAHRAACRRPHRHRRPAAVRDLAVRDPLRHRDADVLAGRLPGAAFRDRAGAGARSSRRGWRWAGVTVATAALAYTHYWTFLMLATVAVFLLVQARRRRHYRKLCLQALLRDARRRRASSCPGCRPSSSRCCTPAPRGRSRCTPRCCSTRSSPGPDRRPPARCSRSCCC